jgi:hypothetical protein
MYESRLAAAASAAAAACAAAAMRARFVWSSVGGKRVFEAGVAVVDRLDSH